MNLSSYVYLVINQLTYGTLYLPNLLSLRESYQTKSQEDEFLSYF